MAGYVIRNPGHPLLSGCKFFAVGDNITTITPIFPPAAVSKTGAVSGIVTADTLSPFPAVKGDGTTGRFLFDVFTSYFGVSATSMTVMGRFMANSPHIGGVAMARTGPSNFGWQLLFSNFSGSENGYNFAVFGEGKFVEAQDTIGANNQTAQNVFVCGTWDNTAKQASMWTRQPTDTAAVYRSTNTNTNSADVSLTVWDIRSTNTFEWMRESGAGTFFNGDVGWLAFFDRVLSQAEIEQWSQDSNWPFTIDVTPPLPFFTAPHALNHPLNTIRRQSMLRGATSAPPPPAIVTNQVQLPVFTGGPLRGPWRRGPASIAASVPVPTPPLVPPTPQVQLPVFTGGPLTGPWHKGPYIPTPMVVPPGAPPIISPQVNLPVFTGGPLTGPWHRGPYMPPVPVPPPPPAPPVPAAAKDRPFFDIDAGKDLAARLRRHTQKLSTVLNSLIRQDILLQTGDVDWTLDVTGTFPTAGLTGTFTDDF